MITNSTATKTRSIMKKIIIACLLATSGASAIAEWTKVSELDDITFYIDYKTIRNAGSLRKVWAVHDLKQRSPEGVMSRRLQSEYDCKAENTRTLALSTHTGPMATGETLFTGGADPNGWRAIPPGTTTERILKIVCGN